MQTLNSNDFEKNRKWKPLLLLLIVVILLGVYQFFLRKKIFSEGIYTIATITKAEGHKGGIYITIDYSVAGKRFSGFLSSDLGESHIGEKYFIKVLTDDPKSIIFLKENPVPGCLLQVVPPKEGWKQIPSCQ